MLHANPHRIVSLVPSTTESVCALGARERLVGCTAWCTHPADLLHGVPRIGGTKNPKREAIGRLEPDLVLGNAKENRVEDLDWFAARFPVLVQTPCTVVEAAACLDELGRALGCDEAAAPFVTALARELAIAPPVRPVRAFYAIWTKPWMGIGRATYVDDVLRRCGFENVTADAGGRYPTIEPDAVRELAPEVVLLPDEPWVFDEAQRQQLAESRVFGEARLQLCSGRDFCWHGVHAAVGLARVRALAQA